MAHREDGNLAKFVEGFCQIHGRFGDKVYRRKNNGQLWIYDYVYKPKYDPTILSRRANCAVKAGASVSNPQYKNYKTMINKIYYYTPYFVYAGVYSLSCETFFKVRHPGEFTVEINGLQMPMWLTKRKMFTLKFVSGEYVIKCYKGDKLYCERRVIVIDERAELEEVYSNWFIEHLEEVLLMPDPRFPSLRLYHRGIEMPVWFQYLVGKTESGIMYRSKFRERFMYVRQPYVHSHTVQGDHFYLSQKNINSCWNAVATGFREVWEKFHIRWFDANYRKEWKIVRQHNLWSKMIFRAGKVLGFDLEELSPSHWLPGIETLGDLITVCGYRNYGLTSAELATRIFINHPTPTTSPKSCGILTEGYGTAGEKH